MPAVRFQLSGLTVNVTRSQLQQLFERVGASVVRIEPCDSYVARDQSQLGRRAPAPLASSRRQGGPSADLPPQKFPSDSAFAATALRPRGGHPQDSRADRWVPPFLPCVASAVVAFPNGLAEVEVQNTEQAIAAYVALKGCVTLDGCLLNVGLRRIVNRLPVQKRGRSREAQYRRRSSRSVSSSRRSRPHRGRFRRSRSRSRSRRPNDRTRRRGGSGTSSGGRSSSSTSTSTRSSSRTSRNRGDRRRRVSRSPPSSRADSQGSRSGARDRSPSRSARSK